MILGTCLCVALLILRVAHSHTSMYMGLLWNLFLAWLPVLSSLIVYNLYKKRSYLTWMVVVASTLIWLLFFPNAFYLVTDVLHLKQPRVDAPYWYDLIVVVAFAWTGCFLGMVSLFLMQALVRKMAGAFASWIFAIGVLCISGFGVYLGYFLRWNSWDIFIKPARLMKDVLVRIRHPFANSQTYVFSVLFSLFFICAYLMLVSAAQFQREVQSPDSAVPKK